MKADPLISVITVCFNSGETISRTLESLRKQTSQNFEFVVIDGASTDSTLSILKENKEMIDHLVSEKDSGIYDAMNKGVALAQGKYISFLNSDDRYPTNTIEIIARTGLDSDIVYGNMLKERHLNGNTYQKLLKPDLRKMKKTMSIFHPSTFVRKELFQKYGGYKTEFKLAADYHWLLRAYLDGASYKYIDETLSIFNSDGVSNYSCESYSEAAKIQEEFNIPSDEMHKLYNLCKQKSKRQRIIQGLSKLPGLKQLYENQVKKNWS